MLKILLVSPDKGSLSEMASAWTESGDVDLMWAESGKMALGIAADTALDLVVTDEQLGDMTGIEFAGKLLAVNPMINCASVNRLPPEAFHEASEGLGLMAQLPVHPDKEHAKGILQRLKHIKSLTGGGMRTANDNN